MRIDKIRTVCFAIIETHLHLYKQGKINDDILVDAVASSCVAATSFLEDIIDPMYKGLCDHHRSKTQSDITHSIVESVNDYCLSIGKPLEKNKLKERVCLIMNGEAGRGNIIKDLVRFSRKYETDKTNRVPIMGETLTDD